MSSDQAHYGKRSSYFRQARRLAMASAQAAGPLWEFRWGSTVGVCLVNRVTLKVVQIAAATAEELRFNLKVARSFSATDDTNTASILRAGDMQKLNGDYTDSLLTAFRESNAATAASGGTLTLDTDSIAQGSYVSLGAANTTTADNGIVIFDFAASLTEQALRLEANEGWAINLEVTKGATTGIVLLMETAWVEVPAYTDV